MFQNTTQIKYILTFFLKTIFSFTTKQLTLGVRLFSFFIFSFFKKQVKINYEKLTSQDIKTITKNLEYEFRSKGGVFEVACIYRKSYVIDMVEFQVLELQKAMKMGDAAFEPEGSHTSYSVSELLKLVEDLCLKSLLL